MTYEYITKHDSPNQSGRRTKKITSITIHHWGIKGQKFDNVVRYLCRDNGSSSAHYVAEAGRVACIVDPDNIAWHAGVWSGNLVSIGIECRPEATDADYQTVAELIAKLRSIYGDIPLKRHKDWKATACPGDWDIARLDRMARKIAKGDTAKPTKPKKPSKPKGQPKKPNIKALQGAVRAKRDNKWGPDTEKRLKAVREASRFGGVDFPYGVSFTQGVVGTERDGKWGRNSRAAHDRTVIKIQKALVKLGYNTGGVDGIWGKRTEAAYKDVRKKARA